MKATDIDLKKLSADELQKLGSDIATELQKRLAKSQQADRRFEGIVREDESVAEKFRGVK